jgi:hypothetical protein
MLEGNPMTQAIDSLQAARDRIAHVIETLQQQNPSFQELDRDYLTEDYLNLYLEKYSPEEILAFPEERLNHAIKDLTAWGTIFGLIADFTPEQMKDFDDAVENRW